MLSSSKTAPAVEVNSCTSVAVLQRRRSCRPMWYSITQILDYNDGRDSMHCSRPKSGCDSSPEGCDRWGAFTVRPWVYQGLNPESLANSYLVECTLPCLALPCLALPCRAVPCLALRCEEASFLMPIASILSPFFCLLLLLRMDSEFTVRVVPVIVYRMVAVFIMS